MTSAGSPDDPGPRYLGPADAPRVAATSPDDVLAATGGRPALDAETAWWVLAFQEYPVRRSFLAGVGQVASREEVVAGPGGALEPRVPEGPPALRLDARAAAAHVRAEVSAAVEDAVRDARRPAVMLSGGLDSSVVAVAASEAWARLGRDPDDLRLHHELPVEGEGEAAHAEAVAALLRRRLRTRRAGFADPYDGTEDCLRRMPIPVDDGGPSALLETARALREDGVDVVLTGEGGDEAFNGAWVRPWARRTPAATAAALAEHAARAVARPLRDAWTGRAGAFRRRSAATALPAGLARMPAGRVSGVDYPEARGGLSGARARRDRMTRTGRVMLVVSALRAAGDLHGVRTRFPLLSARVLDAVVGLDPRLFLPARDGTDKQVARRAFAADLPEPQRARPKWDGTGLPVQRAWQAPRLRGWYERWVRGGALEETGLVDPATAREIVAAGEAGSLGAHWRARALISLGAWCRARGL